MKKIWRANVFTAFPEAFPGNLGVSTIGKSLRRGDWQLNLIDLKQFPAKNDRIDDTPCGGGPGMILSPITFEKALHSLPKNDQSLRKIYFSPRGRQLSQCDIEKISHEDGVIMLCGRYEGVDQRIIDIYEMEEISIGDFVLLGGEAVAMVIIESCVRLLDGIVGDNESITDDSFQNFLLEHDQYTKPQNFQGHMVPEELLSGNHEKIFELRLDQSKILTSTRRPDLWAKFVANKMKI